MFLLPQAIAAMHPTAMPEDEIRFNTDQSLRVLAMCNEVRHACDDPSVGTILAHVQLTFSTTEITAVGMNGKLVLERRDVPENPVPWGGVVTLHGSYDYMGLIKTARIVKKTAGKVIRNPPTLVIRRVRIPPSVSNPKAILDGVDTIRAFLQWEFKDGTASPIMCGTDTAFPPYRMAFDVSASPEPAFGIDYGLVHKVITAWGKKRVRMRQGRGLIIDPLYDGDFSRDSTVHRRALIMPISLP
jgi:hypothetical protein